MARYAGVVGYAEQQETYPGVWEDVIVERKVFGDVLRNTRKMTEDQQVHDKLTVGNYISIVADAYAMAHFFNVRYLTWMGQRWTVSDVEVEHPRLKFRLGGVYHGPAASETSNPSGGNGST